MDPGSSPGHAPARVTNNSSKSLTVNAAKQLIRGCYFPAPYARAPRCIRETAMHEHACL